MIMPVTTASPLWKALASGCWAHARLKFIEAQKAQLRGKPERADMALNLINKLYAVERESKHADDTMRWQIRQ